MPSHVGFTGTQRGMSQSQRDLVLKLLNDNFYLGQEFHHGDCVGSDAQAAALARQVGYRIISHPPLDASKRAMTDFHEEMPARGYLDRNRDIVDAVGVLIATPKGVREELRSGTWATVRYARKRKTHVIIVYPDGVAR